MKYVYAIRGGDYIKVGVSTNPESRSSELQTGNPFPLELLWRWGPLQDYKAQELEGMIHAHFTRARMEGEWFRHSDILAELPMSGFFENQGFTELDPGTRLERRIKKIKADEVVPDTPPELNKMAYRIGEVAAVLGKEVDDVANMVLEGDIGSVVFGRQLRIPHKELMKVIHR